ncbi:DMT family transporter [Lutimonas halocynthiae]|uniref:DMT family transporter n=1 Tax=Lutimonas halocynthiae TaxID=1446477 RepID=UPI0025B57686|nr:DMT family transporter [Lutimonas halocynthiae]MDN3641362.1 DMT family transporter [Lutimonas halocynthiae]
MKSRNIAFLLAFLAALIYGISFTVAKEVMPVYIQPFGFILLRVLGATLLFWGVGIFLKKEKIEVKDYPRLLLAAIFGIALNQLSFFKGLSMTTPINASVIMVCSPIIVLIFSSFLLNEKATKKKLLGIFIGLFGAVLLIIFGKDIGSASNASLGNLLVLVNASSYALYLILIKNLTKKYHAITLAKWLYLIGLFMVIPFGFSELSVVNWESLPLPIIYRIGFIIVFTSFMTYMFNLFAIKELKPTTLSIFIYLQPVIASSYALLVGSDSLNLIKIGSTILIFIGVYLVTRKPKEALD